MWGHIVKIKFQEQKPDLLPPRADIQSTKPKTQNSSASQVSWWTTMKIPAFSCPTLLRSSIGHWSWVHHQVHIEPCSSTLLLCLSRHWDEPWWSKGTRRQGAVIITVHCLCKMHFGEWARSYYQMKIGFEGYAAWTRYLSERLHHEVIQALFRRDLNRW